MELQCDICFHIFDLDCHRPKSLPCGHTICQECVQNPGLGGKCPTCRKDLNADPADLPDTIVVIQLIENDGSPPRKKPITEESEVEQLRRGVEAGRQVVEVMRLVVPKAVEALHRQLDSSVAQLLQVEEALERQVQRGAAGGEGSAPVAEQLQLAVQLEDSLRLLTAKKCSVVAEEEDGATWRACAQLGGFGDILRLQLLQLRADGQLEKVDVAACSDQPGVYVGPPIISVLETTKDDFTDGRLNINDILQDRQRWRHTRSLKISHGAAGSEGLLRVVAPHLEELQIEKQVQPSVMVEVEKMKSLKRLGVKCVRGLDYPDLPLQLEELAIWHPSENQLRCVERMARLRSLRVYDYVGPEMSFAPSQPGALRWLSLGFWVDRKNTMMSLIRAYAASVQELQIYCSVSEDYKDKVFYFPDLGDELVACGLHALRRLVLVRPPNDPCTEQLAGCLLQCRTIGNSLPPHVQVVCQMCHKSPF